MDENKGISEKEYKIWLYGPIEIAKVGLGNLRVILEILYLKLKKEEEIDKKELEKLIERAIKEEQHVYESILDFVKKVREVINELEKR